MCLLNAPTSDFSATCHFITLPSTNCIFFSSSPVLCPAALYLPVGDPGWRPGLYLLPAGNRAWAKKREYIYVYFTMHPGICMLGCVCGMMEKQLKNMGRLDFN